jgi:hypothetical protein
VKTRQHLATNGHKTDMNDTTLDRSTTMSFIAEDLARAHISSRVEQARMARRGHQLATARRLSRKAERAAAQARLALARVI